MTHDAFQTIIGLEVHVQLQTQTKLFCRCSTAFGAPPNTQTCPVCIGMPGALPVMNGKAYQLALRTAVALHCEIPGFTKWDRKQYYYPDLPKGYQISQFDLPMSQNGHLAISDPSGFFEPKKVGIIRAHLEDDAGKSMHDEAASKADSRIDLNRTGTPLLEIVSEPDMRSAAEARAYLSELKLLLMYLDVSDCNMQEGSLRVDANINLHLETSHGKVATPIVEVKNMNSFRAVERALSYEAGRQFELWQEHHIQLGASGGHKTTRGWDDEVQVTRPQREKEESSDYRYFPDPDLVPVITGTDHVEEVRRNLAELPAAIRQRLESKYEITPYDTEVIVNQGRDFVDFYVTVAESCGDGKRASNWLQQDILRTLKEAGMSIHEFPVSADRLGDLLNRVIAGDLDNSRAKDVFSRMFNEQESAEEAMSALGIVKVDTSALENLCRELVTANPKVVTDVQEGKMQAIGALIGQARKRNSNANPAEVKRICLEIIASL